MTASEALQYIESLSPGRGGEEGIRFGDPNVQVRGVLVCFMATLEAIKRATEEGCNLLIAHEDLFYPYDFGRERLQDSLTWSVNRARIQALCEGGITVIRAHGMLDRLCVLDAFADLLGLSKPSAEDGYVRIYDIAPTTLRALAEQVKRAVGLAVVRVTGDLDRTVRRVGLPWGGLGLFVNVSFIESLLAHGPDVLIAGESDDYGMRYVLDAGLTMIETSHSASENPGLRAFASRLARDFPTIKTVFHECPVPYGSL
jgi:putative NIF3 family GTP cyclohydrolase 1 type 2